MIEIEDLRVLDIVRYLLDMAIKRLMKSSTYALLVTIIVLAAGIGTYWYMTKGSEEKVPVVKEGDTISVRYYGYIYYHGERRVFDTNIEEIAKDNSTYPKTLTYKWSGRFDPLTFTVGDGSMIEGFDKGVVGMKLNETKTIVVPPDEGYHFDWSLVQNQSIRQKIAVTENMSLETFKKRYGEENPAENSVYRDLKYGWNSLVLQVKPTLNLVTVMHLAEAGKSYYPEKDSADFRCYVESVQDGYIHVRFYIEKTPILLHDGGIIDWYNDTMFRVNYNKEVAGKTLYFVVTVIDIKEKD